MDPRVVLQTIGCNLHTVVRLLQHLNLQAMATVLEVLACVLVQPAA